MFSARWLGLMLSCFILLTSGGCSLGPTSVRANFLRYNEAVTDKENEQFLLNIVRLRYRDPPKSLAIGNLATQIQVDATDPVSFVNGFIGKTQNVLLPQGHYADASTVSISPLTGADYIIGMVTPVPLERIVMLANSGWDLDRLMRLLVYNMNGVENAAHLAGQGGERAPRFVEFVAVAKTLGRLHHEGLLELAAEPIPVPVANLSEPLRYGEDKKKDGEQQSQVSPLSPSDLMNAASKNYLFEVDEKNKTIILKSTIQAFNMNLAAEAWHDPKLPQVIQTLNLRGGQTFQMLPGETGHLKRKEGAPDNTIRLSTRSVLGSMLYLSKGVDVPVRHYKEGLVTVPRDDAGNSFEWGQISDGVFHVCVSKDRPRHAFVSTKYRGFWYYIPDCDLSSKSTFNLILEMHNVQITKGMTTAPILTLPVNSSGGGARGGGG